MANNEVIELEIQEQIEETLNEMAVNEVDASEDMTSYETPNIVIGSLADEVNEEFIEENETKDAEAKEDIMADQIKEVEGCTIGEMIDNKVVETKAKDVVADKSTTEKPKSKANKVAKTDVKAKTAKIETVKAKVEKAEKVSENVVETKAKEPSYSIFQHITDSLIEVGHRIAADACQLGVNYKAYMNATTAKQVMRLNQQIKERTDAAKELQSKKDVHLNAAEKLREKWVKYANEKKALKECVGCIE